MSTGNPLEQLRRRMQSHATPTAFAALAEEHRRAGRYDEAIVVCRDGLARYPAYVSARVTLGRALLDSGDVTGALTELEHAVAQAPDNLAAARALESAHTALGNAPPPPPLTAAAGDLPLRVANDDTASIPASVVAQALGSGPDGPQEFGLGPDWSIPGEPAQAAHDLAPADGEAACPADGIQALFSHADAPTMSIAPQPLQGEEPAGIWPVPESGAVDAHDSLDAARVFSWALDPPPGQEPTETPAHIEVVSPPPVSLWDEPTIEAPVADLYVAPEHGVGTEPAPIAFEPFGTGSVETEAPAPLETLAPVEVSVAAEPAEVGSIASAIDDAVESLLAPEPAGEDLAAAAGDQPSPFWTGAFGGEPVVEAPAPFSGWGDEPPPQETGVDRSPWADEALADQSGPWAVPDGPSAAWALGDLHEASGADATPFATTRDAVPDVATAALLDDSVPAAPDVEAAPPAEIGWEGSVKSALGEVFARAGHGESLEPPTHPSPAVRTAMADAAVEAALEDAVLRDDAPASALASLQQMLDSVRARRAALFGDLHS
jgi:hypothetical protein